MGTWRRSVFGFAVTCAACFPVSGGGAAVAASPDDGDLADVVRRAEADVRRGQMADALEIYDQALERLVENGADVGVVHLNRGVVRYRSGRLEGALSDFREGEGSAVPEVRFRCLFNRGRVLFDLAQRAAPRRRSPGSLSPREAVGLLVAARRAFVDALLCRPGDSGGRETLQAVSEEIVRWRRSIASSQGPDDRGGGVTARADEAGNGGESPAGAAGGAGTGQGPGAGRGQDGESPPVTPVVIDPAVQPVAALDEGQLADLRRRLDEVLRNARAARRLRRASRVSAQGRDW